MMKSVEDLEDKNVLVLGMAKSGVSAALLLHRLRANVLVNDANANQPQELIKKLENKGIRMVLGEHPTNILSQNKIELIVKIRAFLIQIPF